MFLFETFYHSQKLLFESGIKILGDAQFLNFWNDLFHLESD